MMNILMSDMLFESVLPYRDNNTGEMKGWFLEAYNQLSCMDNLYIINPSCDYTEKNYGHAHWISCGNPSHIMLDGGYETTLLNLREHDFAGKISFLLNKPFLLVFSRDLYSSAFLRYLYENADKIKCRQDNVLLIVPIDRHHSKERIDDAIDRGMSIFGMTADIDVFLEKPTRPGICGILRMPQIVDAIASIAL